MKFLTRKMSVARKILIILLVALMLIFAITPNYSVQAVEVVTQEDMPDEGGSILGPLLKELIQLIVSLGDIAMGALNYFMLGADGFTSAMLSPEDPNFSDPDSWLYVDEDEEVDYEYESGTINTASIFSWITGKDYDIPNFLYSPENIFSNNIAALDVNFLNPNTYEAISHSGERGEDGLTNAERAAQSAAGGQLRKTISDWYISFRNIAIVGLLSVLVYLGIRILISSAASDKAKYKESLRDWVVALCLVFFIHFLMSGLLMIADKFTDLISPSIDDGIIVHVADGDVTFRTNIIGLARFNAQSQSVYNTVAYSILYLVLVIYTFVFTFMYFKRFLYMAFFTMIAPLVALTYPIDKAGDGHAQAFNLWFKEYTMNLILQPVHLILYIALVSSAMDLVKQNMIYAIVAIGFLIPAEKFIKKMFGMDKAETPSGFGSFAAGAATMSGFKQVARMLTGGKDKKSSGGSDNSSSTSSDVSNTRVRTQDRGFLSSYRNGNNAQQLPQGNSSTNENQPDGQQVRQQQQLPSEQQGEQEDAPSERQRMLDDRNIWQGMVDDPNTSDLDRDLAQQEVNNINDEMRANGYLDEDEENRLQEQQRLLDQRRIWDDIANDPNASDEEKLEALENISYINDNINGLNETGVTQTPPPQQQKQDNEQQENTQSMPKRQEGWLGKRTIRGIKKGSKYLLKGGKLAAQGLGIAGGAVVGLAAGTATGDFSNAMAFMGTGALAGRSLGRAAGNLPERAVNYAYRTRDKVEDKLEEYQYNKDKDLYGVSYAAQQSAIRQNERAKETFLRDKKEQAKYEEMAGRIYADTGHQVDSKDLMNAAFDYKKAGITDEKQIENGLALEASNGGVNGNKHESMIDVINMANSYGKDYVLDDKKRPKLQEQIKDAVGHSNVQAQNEIWDFYTQALGINSQTASRYAINPPAQQTQQNQPAQQAQQQGPQRGPGRPRQNQQTQQPGGSQRGPGRPRQNQNPQQQGPQRGPGRPRQNPTQQGPQGGTSGPTNP